MSSLNLLLPIWCASDVWLTVSIMICRNGQTLMSSSDLLLVSFSRACCGKVLPMCSQRESIFPLPFHVLEFFGWKVEISPFLISTEICLTCLSDLHLWKRTQGSALCSSPESVYQYPACVSFQEHWVYCRKLSCLFRTSF